MSEKTVQTLEQLSQRYSQLHVQRVRAQANLDNAQEQLGQLEKQALESFGTSDLEELKAKLAAMESENEKRLVEYQQHLDTIETNLAKIEKEYDEMENQS